MPDPIQTPATVLSFDAEQRTLQVRVVPYGPVIKHNGVEQRYTRVDVPEGRAVPFTVVHEVPGETGVLNRIGKIVAHEQTDDGLVATLKLAQTAQANDVYALAQDGLISDVSGGVIVTSEEMDGDVAVRQGQLDHVAASVAGAFGASDPGSNVLAVHDKEGSNVKDTTTDPATDPVVGLTEQDVKELFDVDSMQDEIRAMRQTLDGIADAPAAAKPRPEGYETFAAVVKSRVTGDEQPIRDLMEQYALVASPGVSGGSGAAEGLIPADWWTGGLVDVRGGFRPLFNHCGSIPYPTTGTAVGYGKVVSGPTADDRAAQDGDMESSALVVSAASAAIKWFDGAGRVPIEIIEQSDPAIMAVFWGRLVSAVNTKVEAYTVATAVAAATHQGAVLTFTSYKTLVTDLVTTSELIRVATDYPGDHVGMSTSDWIEALTMVDGNDRRLFATQGSAAADGSAGLLSSTIDIGGITAFHAPGLSESLQYNKVALKATDKAPRRLQAVNVLKAGVEVGVLGSAIVAPMIATGIYSYEAV